MKTQIYAAPAVKGLSNVNVTSDGRVISNGSQCANCMIAEIDSLLSISDDS